MLPHCPAKNCSFVLTKIIQTQPSIPHPINTSKFHSKFKNHLHITHKTKRNPSSRSKYICHKMRTNVNDASTSTSFSKNLKRRRPIPHRGQIKMKIAAKAFQSLVSIVSASSAAQYLNSPRKKSQY